MPKVIGSPLTTAAFGSRGTPRLADRLDEASGSSATSLSGDFSVFWLRRVILGCLILTLGVQSAVPCCVLSGAIPRSKAHRGSGLCPCCGARDTVGDGGNSHATDFPQASAAQPNENGSGPKCPFCSSPVDLTHHENFPGASLKTVDHGSVPEAEHPITSREGPTTSDRSFDLTPTNSRRFALGRLMQ